MPSVAAHLSTLLDGYQRPRMRDVLEDMRRTCEARDWPCPSRAAIYAFSGRAPVRSYRVADLPSHVQEALFNLGPDSEIPGDQLVFHCLNYGGTAAIGFAAGLPWRHLDLALQKRGWRPKSRGLLQAIVRARRS